MARKRFNVVLDPLPSGLKSGGRFYPAHTDFRRVLSYLRIIENEEDEDRGWLSVACFFDDITGVDMDDLQAWLESFLLCGEERQEDGVKQQKVFDILKDFNFIYAGFMQAYGINLREVTMHWFTFMALLDGLPSGTKLSDVMSIRSKKIENWMKPEDVREISRMKQLYSLEETVDPMDALGSMLRSMAK